LELIDHKDHYTDENRNSHQMNALNTMIDAQRNSQGWRRSVVQQHEDYRRNAMFCGAMAMRTADHDARALWMMMQENWTAMIPPALLVEWEAPSLPNKPGTQLRVRPRRGSRQPARQNA
jgi:hypothetical protein